MTHQLLSDARRDAGPRQPGSERRPQAVDIDDKSPIVPVCDPGPAAIGVEPCNQCCRDVEQRVGRFPSLDLASKHDDQIRAERDDVSLSVLGNGGSQPDDRNDGVKVQVGNRQLLDLSLSQSGSRQERVQVGSVAS